MKKLLVIIFLFIGNMSFAQTYPTIYDPTTGGEYVQIIEQFKIKGFYEIDRIDVILEDSCTFYKIIQDNIDFVIAIYQTGNSKTVIFYFRQFGNQNNKPSGKPVDCLIHDRVRTVIGS